MAKTEGFNQYVCDRCSAEVYAIDTDPNIQAWKNIERMNAEGTSVKRWLCAKCSKEYRNLVQNQDSEFLNFMVSGVRK